MSLPGSRTSQRWGHQPHRLTPSSAGAAAARSPALRRSHLVTQDRAPRSRNPARLVQLPELRTTAVSRAARAPSFARAEVADVVIPIRRVSYFCQCQLRYPAVEHMRSDWLIITSISEGIAECTQI